MRAGLFRGKPGVVAEPVAMDSFGVMGMCVRIETPDVVVTVDPAASLEPDSFPLPAAERQRRLAERLELVAASCAKSQAIVISHYHLDHFQPERDPRLYGGKVIFAKNPDDLPPNPAGAARRFFETISGLPSEVIWADGRRFRFGKTEVGFSSPLWHGAAGAEPGRVIVTDVKRGRDCVLVASDVAGPVERETARHIAESRATTVFLDGYPTYRFDRFATDTDHVRSLVLIGSILAAPAVRTVVLDHHACRDPRYPWLFRLAYSRAASLGKELGTAAELAGAVSAVLSGPPSPEPGLARADARIILETAVAEGRLTPDWLDDFDRWLGLD